MLNPELVEKVLQEIGCENIHHYSDRITSTRIGGNNQSAVCCYLGSDQYHTEIFTRSDYQALPIRDIIAAVGYMLQINFPQSMKKICNIIGADFYQDLNEPEQPKLLSFLDFIEGHKQTLGTDTDKIRILPEKVLDQFVKLPSLMWYNEGIKISSQQYYQVAFDPISERIVFPIYDSLGSLISVKGRDITNQHESKYLYIFPCTRGNILYGEWQNTEEIKKAGSVLVFEAEKSVMKAHSLGFKNSIGIGTKSLTESQCQNILRLNTDIILCLDNDVSDIELNEIVKQLQYPVTTQKIYIIRDRMNLYLGEKDSPVDTKDFIELYNNFKELV